MTCPSIQARQARQGEVFQFLTPTPHAQSSPVTVTLAQEVQKQTSSNDMLFVSEEQWILPNQYLDTGRETYCHRLSEGRREAQA